MVRYFAAAFFDADLSSPKLLYTHRIVSDENALENIVLPPERSCYCNRLALVFLI